MNEELGDWLALASGDVPVGEQQRLRAELVGHYEDAVNLYVQQGKSPVEAHRAALADLGDPHETADAARRIYGTRSRARIWPSFGREHGGARMVFSTEQDPCSPAADSSGTGGGAGTVQHGGRDHGRAAVRAGDARQQLCACRLLFHACATGRFDRRRPARSK